VFLAAFKFDEIYRETYILLQLHWGWNFYRFNQLISTHQVDASGFKNFDEQIAHYPAAFVPHMNKAGCKVNMAFVLHVNSG
jgi:hypothetical protein